MYRFVIREPNNRLTIKLRSLFWLYSEIRFADLKEFTALIDAPLLSLSTAFYLSSFRGDDIKVL